MSENDYPVRWNVGKKRERDEKADQDRVKAVVGKVYTNWFRIFVTKKLTLDDLPREFNNLRAIVMQTLKDEKMTEFREFTEQLLNEIQDRVRAFVKAHDPESPNWLQPDVPHSSPVAFHSEEEFMAIPLVSDHFSSPDFIGVFLKYVNPWDITVFLGFKVDGDDLRTVSIGRVVKRKGLERIPTLREYVSLLAQTRAESAAAAQSPESASAPESAGGTDTASSSDTSGPASGDSGLGPTS